MPSFSLGSLCFASVSASNAPTKSGMETTGQGANTAVPFQNGHPSTPGRDQNTPPPPPNVVPPAMTAGAAANNAAAGGGFLGLFRGSASTASGVSERGSSRTGSNGAITVRDGDRPLAAKTNGSNGFGDSNLVKLPQVTCMLSQCRDVFGFVTIFQCLFSIFRLLLYSYAR